MTTTGSKQDTVFVAVMAVAVLLVVILLVAIAVSVFWITDPIPPQPQQTMPDAPLIAARTDPPPESIATEVTADVRLTKVPEPIHHAYLASVGRSPMPQPGETISEPIWPVELEDPHHQFGGEPAPEIGPVIRWDKAHQYVGQSVTVEGKIVHTGIASEGTIRFLNFDKDWRDKFYVAVFPQANVKWPEPAEKHFLNKTIRVRGPITTYRDCPQIRVHRASQISIVSDDR